MKHIFYLSLICFSVIACKQEEKSIRNMKADKIIDATEISNDKFSLNNIIDSSYFIPLETNDENLIKNIDKIVFDDDKIFVLDFSFDLTGNNKLLVFDRQGNFMYSIGKVGQGPGEYSSACDFCLNKQDKMIYLLCERRRIMQYNYNGDFVEQKKMDFFAAKVEYSNNYFYFQGDQSDFVDLLITDINCKIIDKFFPVIEDWGKDVHRWLLPHTLQRLDSFIYYIGFMDDNIYGINDTSIFVPYRMDFGKTKIPFSKVKEYGPVQSYTEGRGYIQYWIQNSDYSICYYFDTMLPVMNIYNREKGISQNYYYKDIRNQYAAQWCFFEYLTDTDELVAVVQPADLLEHIEFIENEDDKNYIKSMKLNEDMNPLLYIVKTK